MHVKNEIYVNPDAYMAKFIYVYVWKFGDPRINFGAMATIWGLFLRWVNNPILPHPAKDSSPKFLPQTYFPNSFRDISRVCTFQTPTGKHAARGGSVYKQSFAVFRLDMNAGGQYNILQLAFDPACLQQLVRGIQVEYRSKYKCKWKHKYKMLDKNMVKNINTTSFSLLLIPPASSLTKFVLGLFREIHI